MTSVDLALLALRVVVGLLFVGYGSQKPLGAGLLGGGATVIAGRLAADRDDRGARPHPA